jgi:hypothetical protein
VQLSFKGHVALQQEDFLSIQGAVERLAELGRPLSTDRLRALIDVGQLPCAVYWLTRYCWLYVDQRGAAHHEEHGWPEWAAPTPEDVCPSENNPDPCLIYFTDEADHLNLNDRIGRPRPCGSGGLNLAKFRSGLFISADAIETLAAGGKPSCEKHPAPLSRTKAQDDALLAAVEKAGYDPFNLPKNNPGKRGVKAEMKEVLENSHVFTSAAFGHAWKRLKKLQHFHK